jgi:predicted nuclease of predicted toxin-antitoxin system
MTGMPLKLYMDHHVPRAITIGLRLRQVDVLTAYEDQAHEIADPDLLDRATSLGRVLFTQDDDLLAEAMKRQHAEIVYGGVIYAHQQDVSIGQCVQDLELITTAGTEADVVNRVIYLPL